MFANSSLIENSVINLDMLYKYVFSSITPGYSISSTAYTPYSEALKTEINNAVYTTDEMYQVPNREGGLLEGFTWHPGDDTAMDTEYDDPTSNNGEYAGIKVQDSIALNPYILFGGIMVGGSISTPVNVNVTSTTIYTITFEDDSTVFAYISVEMSVGAEEDYSIPESATINITFSDDYTMEDVKAMGEVRTISLYDRTIDVDTPGYACRTLDLAEEYGRFCLKRGSLIWNRIVEDEVTDFYISDWVSETDIVNTNFSGMSQYNIEACIYEYPTYEVYLDVIPTAMTWTDRIETIDGSTAETASSFTAILYGNNNVAKVNRSETLSVGENDVQSYGQFDKLSDDEVPYTVEWSRNSGPYYLMTSSVTMNGNNVVSAAKVGLEYELILFTYSTTAPSLYSHHTIYVTNSRTNERVRLEGDFINNYGPQSAITFVDGDILYIQTTQDLIGEISEIEVDGGYLTGSTIQTFNYVATVATESIGGYVGDFTTPPIDGTNHFNNNRARAAIRLNIIV